MNFATYAAFRSKVQAIIDGDDISTSSISTALLDTMVDTGEQRLYRDVKSSTQDASLAVTVTSAVATLPSDCLELKSVFISQGRPLKWMPYEDIEARIQTQTASSTSTGGPSCFFYSLEGDNIVLWPQLNDGTVINGRYLKQFPAITSATGLTGNTFFARWPDLWLYAALAESAPILGDDERIPLWEAKYKQLVFDVKKQEDRRGRMGSKMQTRVVR
jgi:hypothetical protein